MFGKMTLLISSKVSVKFPPDGPAANANAVGLSEADGSGLVIRTDARPSTSVLKCIQVMHTYMCQIDTSREAQSTQCYKVP